MRTIATQVMHSRESDGRWINVPQDMGAHYKRLGWEVRELVDREEAESLMHNLVNGHASPVAA